MSSWVCKYNLNKITSKKLTCHISKDRKPKQSYNPLQMHCWDGSVICIVSQINFDVIESHHCINYNTYNVIITTTISNYYPYKDHIFFKKHIFKLFHLIKQIQIQRDENSDKTAKYGIVRHDKKSGTNLHDDRKLQMQVKATALKVDSN